MIELDAATVLLQWATGGLFFLWITGRRRLVGGKPFAAPSARRAPHGSRCYAHFHHGLLEQVPRLGVEVAIDDARRELLLAGSADTSQ